MSALINAGLTWAIDIFRPRLDEPPIDWNEVEEGLVYALLIIIVAVLAASLTAR
jgi:hypothetical protein